MCKKFEIEFLGEAIEFLDHLDHRARYKIIYNIQKAQRSQDRELFKKLYDEIWEFRTLYNRTYYRIFAFWDKTDRNETLVIATHGIIKKTGRTQERDIEKAIQLRNKYLESE